MQVFDKHQINIAKQTLRLSDIGAHIMGGMTKPEAVLLLKANGMSVTKITNLLVNSGHSNEEIQKIFCKIYKIF
jgi:hypothetical protein